MPRRVRLPFRRRVPLALACGALVPLSLAWGPMAQAGQTAAGGPTYTGPRELSTTTRLADRRAVVIGTRAYEVSDETGEYPGTGWHTQAEMGGFWSPPIKLLDGVWFSLDGSWLGSSAAPATRFTSGWGYTRIDYSAGGLKVSRTDVVPDGRRGVLLGLTLTGQSAQTVKLALDAHSELMSAYPWGWTTPDQSKANLPDTGQVSGNALLFRDTGTPPFAGATPHDWAAEVGSTLTPTGSSLGPDFRGPQDPAVICPASGSTDPTPARCDDSAYGQGTGGQLTYAVPVSPDHPTTVWFAVAGSDTGPADATSTLHGLLANPAGLLAAKKAARQAVEQRSEVSLPGDPLLTEAVAWYKQNLADTVQQAQNLQLRATNQGTEYPPALGTLPVAQWFGAGWPDYPWLFATDGEYTAFAAVAAGQFTTIEDHLRALMQASDIVNDRSGKVLHEMVSTGDVYYGTNSDPGNTDETAKFPSAVALVWRWTGDNAFRDEMYDFTVRNMHYVVDQLDTNGDGWPEGSGNVERSGMDPEKLDNAVYTIRGLRDLEEMARSKGDTATATWADQHASALEQKFEADWWYGGDTNSYADSRDGDTGEKLFQRYWIGLTPTDAEIVRPGQVTRPLATDAHGNATLDQHEKDCFTFPLGMWHTGTGPTSDPAGNPGPSCDSVVSSAPSDREAFSLNTAVAAVSEGNFGRMGADQMQRYTTALARIALDPTVWEMPGDSPEIAPGGSFGANIDLPFTARSSMLQAWGGYGVLWPVVHQELGVDPDLGVGQLAVVPQIPDGQTQVAGRDIALGSGSVDVAAWRSTSTLRTVVDEHLDAALTIGAVLPSGAKVAGVTLDGRSVAYQLVQTASGTEVQVAAGSGGTHTLVVRLS